MRFVLQLLNKSTRQKGASLDASDMVHVGDRDKMAALVADVLNEVIRRHAGQDVLPEHPLCIACVMVAASDGAATLVRRYHPDVTADEVRRVFGSIVAPVGRQG
jgi:hypothetical protein